MQAGVGAIGWVESLYQCPAEAPPGDASAKKSEWISADAVAIRKYGPLQSGWVEVVALTQRGCTGPSHGLDVPTERPLHCQHFAKEGAESNEVRTNPCTCRARRYHTLCLRQQTYHGHQRHLSGSIRRYHGTNHGAGDYGCAHDRCTYYGTAYYGGSDHHTHGHRTSGQRCTGILLYTALQ
jgi:hypothetical protein